MNLSNVTACTDASGEPPSRESPQTVPTPELESLFLSMLQTWPAGSGLSHDPGPPPEDE